LSHLLTRHLSFPGWKGGWGPTSSRAGTLPPTLPALSSKGPIEISDRYPSCGGQLPARGPYSVQRPPGPVSH
jgi:hypothetical protein